MPNGYLPTTEHLARLGYGPDAAHDLPTAGFIGYSRQLPAPWLPYVATFVVQVHPTDGRVHLLRLAKTNTEPWAGHPVPTAYFFEQLLQAIGWPVGPALPRFNPEASEELMLLRWVAAHPAEAYRLRDRLSSYSCLPGLHFEGLLELIDPEREPPGAGPPKLFLRPGLIVPTSAGSDYLHQRRTHRETPKNLPAFITKTTNEQP
jgi:hypothetical protein